MDAILILLSFGEFIKVMEMLFKLGQIDRALLLLESCVEFGLLSLDDITNRIFSNSFFVFCSLKTLFGCIIFSIFFVGKNLHHFSSKKNMPNHSLSKGKRLLFHSIFLTPFLFVR